MDKEEEKIIRELNIRKIVMIIIIGIIAVAVIGIFSLYIAEEDFRKWVDISILRKDITSDTCVI